jgi:hypothetical protein
VGLAGAITLGAALPASAAAVSSAYGVKAELLAGAIKVAPTPVSTFPNGGQQNTVQANLGVLGNVKVLRATTSGDETAGTSDAKAEIGKVNLLLGSLPLVKNSGITPTAAAAIKAKAAAITADAITATCTASGGQLHGNADLANLTLGGGEALNAHPGPNTDVSVPGVLRIILNEQSTRGGVLEVNAVHITLLSGVGGDLILGHAQCGPNAPEEGSPIVTKGFLGGFGVLVIAGAGAFIIRRRRVGSAV